MHPKSILKSGRTEKGFDTESENLSYLEQQKEKKKRITGATVKECLIYSKYMRISYVIILCLSVALFAPWIINTQMSFAPKDNKVSGTCHVQIGVRTNCFPDRFDSDNATEEECIARNCCYQNLNLYNSGPVCHRKIPSTHTLNVTSDSQNTTDGTLGPAYPDISNAWPEPMSSNLSYQVRQFAPGHVSALLFDKNHRPDFDPGTDTNLVDIGMSVRATSNDNRLALQMWRKTNDRILIDASYGSVYVTQKYSEISLLLPSGVIYGLGGHPLSFNLTGSFSATNFIKKVFFNIDPEHVSDHQHSLPIFMMTDSTKKFAGVYVETAGAALEVEVMPGLFLDGTLEPTENQTVTAQRPMLVFRSTSDFLLLHLFVGPTPREVMKQMTNYLGKPKLPSITSLGLHVCRRTSDDVADFRKNLAEMNKFGIPFDTDCISENILQTAFQPSTDLQIETLLPELESAGKQFVLSLPPHVAYNDAMMSDKLFIQNEFNNQTVTTEYGGTEVALPDFSNPDIGSWFKDNLNVLLGSFSKKPVGIHLIKNSPYFQVNDECDLESYPFLPYGSLDEPIFSNNTVCPNSNQKSGKHFSLHNSYSTGQATKVQESLDGLGIGSTYIFSKHSDPGLRHGLIGSDRTPSWENLGASLREVLEMGISGAGLVSMQVCGLETEKASNATLSIEELCLRWYQLSAFMPAIHAIHTDVNNSSMPYDFTKRTYTNWTRRALQRRLKLTPYMLTQMFIGLQQNETSYGSPLVRPLFFEFPDDLNLNNYHIIWKQFMFGESIMVNPIIDPEIRLLEAYFPEEIWYELWSGLKIEGLGKTAKTEAIQAQIPSYIRSGSIIPILAFHESEAPLSTLETFEKFNHSLIVALSCPKPDPRRNGMGLNCTAKGSLLANFDGSSDQVSSNLELIRIYAEQSNGIGRITLSEATWTGCNITRSSIQGVVIYGAKQPTDQSFSYDPDLMRLQIDQVDLYWCNSTNLSFEWDYIETS